MDEGDYNILEVAGSAECKEDTSAQMTYCKSSLKGTFIPSMGKRGIRKYSRRLGLLSKVLAEEQDFI